MAPSSATTRTSESDFDDVQSNSTEALTPNTDVDSSPTLVEKNIDDCEESQQAQKKKKKKKPKKSAKSKAAKPASETTEESRPNVLCISRNKHWKYISSYHGPWLQLPVELLESLLTLNLDPATLTAPEPRSLAIEDSGKASPTIGSILHTSQSTPNLRNNKQRKRGPSFPGLGIDSVLYDFSPPDSPRASFSSSPSSILELSPGMSQALPLPTPPPGKAMPPPIDPGVFRSVTTIRRLIDEAAELSVRASTGMSASELRAAGGGLGFGFGGSGLGGLGGLGSGSPWAAAQSLGINPLGTPGGNGRNVAMSAMRIHRLRALAVQKLAQAYKQDEIASSVMVMQGGSVFDDVAERVLKTDPHDPDAKYVHFFHEKIPSRQLAESTPTDVLDQLIRQFPHRIEFHRTRGIVHCFRDEYAQATKDFTYAIKEARAQRRAKMAHSERSDGGANDSSAPRARKGRRKTNGQAPPNGTSSVPDELNGSGLDSSPEPVHPSVLSDAPDPIEPQCMFFRGAAYLQHAVYLVEGAVLTLEGVEKGPALDVGEMRLCYVEDGRFGGVEMGHPDGPLGNKDGKKLHAYRDVLCETQLKDQVEGLLKKSIRDHEKFLSYFDMLESKSPHFNCDIAEQIDIAFHASESIRPGQHQQQGSPTMPSLAGSFADKLAIFSTYHPLLVEAHFSILLCKLMLADFEDILPTFVRTAAVVDGLEGYPVFLLPRSLAQAEFIEVLERLAGGWKIGVQPHSLSRSKTKEKILAIEAPPSPSSPAQERSSPSMTSKTANGASSSSEEARTPTFRPAAVPPRADASTALDCARILLAPVHARQRERAAAAANDKRNKKGNNGAAPKPLSLNIPLHGPRVEVVLAWMGAVHLPELVA